jgi:hypothetical protein
MAPATTPIGACVRAISRLQMWLVCPVLAQFRMFHAFVSFLLVEQLRPNCDHRIGQLSPSPHSGAATFLLAHLRRARLARILVLDDFSCPALSVGLLVAAPVLAIVEWHGRNARWWKARNAPRPIAAPIPIGAVCAPCFVCDCALCTLFCRNSVCFTLWSAFF